MTLETCYYCDRPAVTRCTWRTGDGPAFAPIEAGALVTGDRIQQLTFRGTSFALVLSIREFDGYRDFQLAIPARKGGNLRLKLWSALRTHLVKAYRVQACGLACCENHHREPGEGRAYCVVCWRLQDAAA